MKRKKLAGRALGLLGVLLVVSGGVLVVARPPQPQLARSSETVSPAPRTQLSTASGTTATSTAGPARLRIPAIGVDAAVESVGVTAEGDLHVPRDARDVGWYSLRPSARAAG